MEKNKISGLVAVLVVIALVLVSSAAVAKSPNAHRGAPTAPTNLAVNAAMPYSVSLSWGASTDNSGVFSYVIVGSNGRTTSVPQSLTSYTVSGNLWPQVSYSFSMYAIDGGGVRSASSNTVTVTLPADTTLPTKPVVTVTAIGPTHVSLSWLSTDDAPNLYYTLYMNGNFAFFAAGSTSHDVKLLLPETTYSFTVEARNNVRLFSPMSDPLSVTTAASDPNDVTPPTTPANLRTNGMVFGDEIWLFWDQSTDNVDPQQYIRYDVFDNGVLVERTAGADRTIFYGFKGVLNTITLTAIDAAGNESPPTTIEIDVAACGC